MLLVTSTGILRISATLPRNRSGRRSVMSNVFSPSIIDVNALPRTAVSMTFCTSATLTA